MLYKGKRNGYYLYELTEADLVLHASGQKDYHAGNVLLFSHKRQISLGLEAVKADDYETALAYLNKSEDFDEIAREEQALTVLKQQLAQSEASLKHRDGLLQDLTADLASQRSSNDMLIAQLETLREQIQLERITRSEVIGDLEFASAETLRKEQQLQEAIDAKTKLEQELAERICELLELNFANEDLQKTLEEQMTHTSFEPPSSLQKKAKTAVEDHGADPATTQTLTLPSGKQIQIYHEFGNAQQTRRIKSSAMFWGILRIFALLAVAALLLIATSVVATAYFNDLSFGEALDVFLKALLP